MYPPPCRTATPPADAAATPAVATAIANTAAVAARRRDVDCMGAMAVVTRRSSGVARRCGCVGGGRWGWTGKRVGKREKQRPTVVGQCAGTGAAPQRGGDRVSGVGGLGRLVRRRLPAAPRGSPSYRRPPGCRRPPALPVAAEGVASSCGRPCEALPTAAAFSPQNPNPPSTPIVARMGNWPSAWVELDSNRARRSGSFGQSR